MVNIYILCRTTFFALVFFVIDGVYYFPCCVMGWRINIILGRVSSVGRSINTMAKRSSMLGGRGCVMGRRINIMLGRVSVADGTGSMEGGRVSMEVTNAQTLVGRVSSAVGSVRTKAIKKGSTEVLPLDVLLI